MNRQRRNRNRRPATPARRSQNAVRNVNRQQNLGATPRGRPDPTPVITNPWWPVVFVFRQDVNTPFPVQINRATLLSYLLGEFNIPAATQPLFRVMRIDVWSLSRGKSITLSPIDWTTNNPLASIDDTPGLNHYAHAHFVYPKTISTSALTVSNGNIATFAVPGPAGTTSSVEIRIHVHWKPSFVAAPPSGPPSTLLHPVEDSPLPGDVRSSSPVTPLFPSEFGESSIKSLDCEEPFSSLSLAY